jgi:HlyD family secretion protein
MPASTGQRLHTIAVVAALAAAAGILAFLILRPGVVVPPSPGLVQATEIRIGPEIGGRLLRFAVAAGQPVHRGDLLAELSNPELEAALVLARAQLGAARAGRDRVYAGPRQEQVDALARDIDMANANLAYARQQFSRTAQLAASGFASRQDLDKATTAVETTNANLARARERYQAARLGPTREQRAIADAKVDVAAAAVAVVAARVAKLRIEAPTEGTVALLVAEPGEAIVPGQPVMTLQAAGQRWASFNLREDRLGGLSLGAPVALEPADGGAPIAARIDEIVPYGEFATWRAARAVGAYDLNTMLVRADAVNGARGLQPGMTVWLRRQ